ncbi:MAG: histidine kinase dimerization/phosphoacceptor domain -containing protein [Bacteroidota bacterium]
MKTLLSSLINLGITDALNSHERRRIRTVNLLNAVIIFFLATGLINFFILKNDYNFTPFIVFTALCLASLFLNKIHQSSLSALLFTLNMNVEIFYINKTYPVEVGSYLYYYPVIVSVVLLNNPQTRDRFALIHFLTCLLFFLCNLFLDFPEWQNLHLKQDQIQKMWLLNIVISTTVTGTIVYLLTRLISNQNKEISLQNLDLISAKENINASLKEKEVLLAELNHRVKNNLAIISGLLNLQESSIENHEAKQIIGDSKNRINSMALVHKMLYKNADLKNIDLSAYVSELIDELFRGYQLDNKVEIHKKLDPIILAVNKSIPLGLILNEIITNSIKYVYANSAENSGLFEIHMQLQDNKVMIEMNDHGLGFPTDFNAEQTQFTLGIFLIKSLTEQIDGEVRFSNEGGAKIALQFLAN